MTKPKIGTKVRVNSGSDEGAGGHVVNRKLVPTNRFGVPQITGHKRPMNREDVAVIVGLRRNILGKDGKTQTTTIVKTLEVYPCKQLDVIEHNSGESSEVKS